MSFHLSKNVVVTVGEDKHWVVSQCEKGQVVGASEELEEL